ncbi:MAG: CoA-binding protein, partial [Chloroflexota bacterium]|nr:CoA-binding protein [Chloroflexota bacterium]
SLVMQESRLAGLFNPESVAVVGVSRVAQPTGGTAQFVMRLQAAGFPGPIYPINPQASTILGLKAYPNLRAVPQPVGLVIIGVPAPDVPPVLEECLQIGATNVHLYTAGFKETGRKEGIRLEKQIKDIAARGRLNLVGPNCMGLYVPAKKLISFGALPEGSGNVAFLSQSGGLAEDYSQYARSLDIRFSKIVSFGNGCVLDATDFLEYLAGDPETRIVGMYLEGIKDGRRFTALVREVNRRKPVVVWKGGLTASGSRAVSSHTGSLAGAEAVWNAFFEQTGAIQAGSLVEMAGVTKSLLHLPPPRGRRLALWGSGGGSSVALADACAREGLEVPVLRRRTRQELQSYVPIAGSSVRNPLDATTSLRDSELAGRTLHLLNRDSSVDLIVVNRNVGNHPEEQEHLKGLIDEVIGFCRQNHKVKPLAVALGSPSQDIPQQSRRLALSNQLARAGVPVFDSVELAARALSKWVGYYEFQRLQRGAGLLGQARLRHPSRVAS